jgi:hypothetical protein
VFVEASLVGDVAHLLRFTPNVLGFLGGYTQKAGFRVPKTVLWLIKH